MPKKLLIKSFGCQMNVYDSARMADLLTPLGYQPTDVAEDADMVVLNTCHIREKASEKVFSELGRLKSIKDQRALTIVVAGCVAQAEGQEIQRRQPAVDIVVGPQAYHRLPELIATAARVKGHVLDTDFPAMSKFDALPKPKAVGATAFLTIQEGCDKFCSFCVVPYTRGAEASRPLGAILAEAEHLVASGVKEITLLGQNVNAYHGLDEDGGTVSLARLLKHLSGLSGLERLRYTTSHPNDMDDDLIAAHGDLDRLMPFLHLPVQSGSDRILAAMNRRHRIDSYLDLIARIRSARPDIALSSDFIVGFPGETEADFEATLDLVARVKFAQAYSFKYSPRPGTPAAALADQIPDGVKAARLDRLQQRLSELSRAFNEAQIGRVLPVLFDRKGRKAGQMIGRSPYFQSVVVDYGGAMGEILPVEIRAAGPNSLIGEISGEDEAACAA